MTTPSLDLPGTPAPRSGGLGVWSLYFVIKLLLFWQGLIAFHPLPNLAFALLLLLPVAGRLRRRLRHGLAAAAAIALLYHDAFLPPFMQLLEQLKVMQGFSAGYLLELAGRVVKPGAIAFLIALAAGYALVSRYLRVGTLVMMAMLWVCGSQLWSAYRPPPATAPAGQAAPGEGRAVQSLDDKLEAFYKDEGQRRVAFGGPLADPGFDILLIHVCSLAWDDLRTVELDHHPLLSRFDILFTRFNTATAYSGPAALRVLRANCGQPSHKGLYEPAPPQCFLFEELARIGFKTELALNHDGHFDGFLKLIRQEGRLNLPMMPLKGLKVAMTSFDNSPIYDDQAVLERWLEQRQAGGAPHVAAFYNTISLHDGNRVVGASHLNSQDSYRMRAKQLFDDLDRFIDRLEQEQRKVILVMVPEHGAALRGEKLQFSGLREIPTPAITMVPAAIKVVGAGRAVSQVRVEQPASYTAVSAILAKMARQSPFGSDYQPAAYLDGLPSTPYVAETASTVVMQNGTRFMLRQQGADWMDYPVDSGKYGL
ncbi:cellulose synthase operon protein YhjU [Crenobacter luteus]|uniref:cellulose biosynthesis protein BcsG n=1 Tax=Crenobacter luteus TaxID=1452487 RepID=UPI0010459A06|nr:cellulose biosynthesis protein BcsG [Crenobacter luteus]TCP10621.1 cellulose synthase operon protein YhjU [Crenobacter luteus]